jgi:hypothetical protein
MSQVLDVQPASDTQPLSLPELLRKILKPIASLQLTVVLLGMCMVLVLCGTLAQIDAGIWTVVRSYFRSWYVWLPLQLFFHRSIKIPLWIGIPFPGGWTLGFALLFNLLAAHITRFKFTIKRVGIWLIHSGIILLLVGELVTGLFAVESRMTIEEGHSANFVEDNMHYELSVVDTSDPDRDNVVVVPTSHLKTGGTISDPRLAADIEVVKFMANSQMLKKVPENNPANKGAGLFRFAEEKPEVSGVDPKQTVDAPAAYVHLRDKSTGTDLGVWLVGLMLDAQSIEIDGKPYEIALRFKRTYKPYTIHLTKFTHDKYVGTPTPKDFRSHIYLTDPETSTNREVEIYMNTPLRYRGETFYQSGFLDPEETGKRGTILQIVWNPGWQLPYLSCALVAVGMLVHFGIGLTQFLRRKYGEDGKAAAFFTVVRMILGGI